MYMNLSISHAPVGTRTKRTMDKTDHVSGQNGPHLRTKRITFQDKTDQASGQKGPSFWKKTGPVLFRTNRTM